MPSLNVKIPTPRLERPRRKRCLSPYSFIFAQDIDVLESPRGRATHMNEFTQASPSAAEVEGAKQAATTTPSSHKIKQPRNKRCPSPYSIIFAEDIIVLEEPHQQSVQQGPAGEKAVMAARVTAAAVVDPAKKLEETSSGDDIDATVVNDSLNENDQEDAECDQPEFFEMAVQEAAGLDPAFALMFQKDADMPQSLSVYDSDAGYFFITATGESTWEESEVAPCRLWQDVFQPIFDIVNGTWSFYDRAMGVHHGVLPVTSPEKEAPKEIIMSAVLADTEVDENSEIIAIEAGGTAQDESWHNMEENLEVPEWIEVLDPATGRCAYYSHRQHHLQDRKPSGWVKAVRQQFEKGQTCRRASASEVHLAMKMNHAKLKRWRS